MTATWLIVLLLVAFVSARLFRSTKVWWLFLTTIMAGLLVGMLSNEVSYTSKEKQLTSEAQLIDLSIAQETNTYCMQPVYVTETQGYSAVVGYNKVLVKENTNNSVSACYTNGRDSPDIKDSS